MVHILVKITITTIVRKIPHIMRGVMTAIMVTIIYEGIEGIKTIQIYFIHIPDDLESLGIMVGVMML